MSTLRPAHGLVRFGVFEVDPHTGELRKNGVKIKLEGQPFQVLELLLEEHGELVSRDELRRKLWPADTFVDFEQSINAAVKRLREVLSDSAESPRFVETVPRRGYRFICPVENDSPVMNKISPVPLPRRRWRVTVLLTAAAIFIWVLVPSSTQVRDHALGASVRGSEPSRLNPVRVDSEGYQLYLKGRFFWNRRNRQDLLRSLEYFGQLIQSNPHSPWGYAGLADSYLILGNNTFLPASETYPKAEAAARKALELDERIAEAHATLGLVLFHYSWDRPGAEREFQRAIELNPNYAVAYQYYSDILSLWKRPDEAIVQIHFALALDPVSIRINENLGRNLYFARRYDQAIEALLRTVELEPKRPRGLYDRLGWAYLASGRHKEAIDALEKAVEFSGRDSLSIAGLAHAFAVTGNSAGAQKILAELIERAESTYVSPVLVALVHLGLGQTDQALERLEKGLEMKDSRMSWINVDPRFDPLRGNPRFLVLLQRMGFL